MANESKSTQPKRRLGRGLSSLIANSAATPAADEGQYVQVAGTPDEATHAAGPGPLAGKPIELPIDQIGRNPYQPRRDVKEADLADLAGSIAEQGILQPLIVSKSDGGQKPYVLIVGQRRLQAAQQVGLLTVPCVVRQATRQQMLEWAIVENIQRSDLNAMERAEAYRQYMDRFSLTQAQAAERLATARAGIANHLRLLELDAAVQTMVRQGALSFGHARALAGLLGRPREQVALAGKAARRKLSVRQVEQLVAAKLAPPKGAKTDAGPSTSKPAYVVDLEQQLTKAVATRVQIRAGRAKNTGKIVIDYYGLEDFDRIAGKLGISTGQ